MACPAVQKCGSVAASDLGNKKQVIPSLPRNPVALLYLHAKAKERKQGLGIAESFLIIPHHHLVPSTSSPLHIKSTHRLRHRVFPLTAHHVSSPSKLIRRDCQYVPHVKLSLISLLAKATDENLTSENWELILDVCDKVNSKPEEGCVSPMCSDLISRPRDAVAAVTKRFSHRNANVQLYSLTVSPMWGRIAYGSWRNL